MSGPREVQGTSYCCSLLIQQHCVIILGSQGIAPRPLSINVYYKFSNIVLSAWESEGSSAAAFCRVLQLIQQRCVSSLGVLSTDLISNSAALCYQLGTQRSPPWQLSIVFCDYVHDYVASKRRRPRELKRETKSCSASVPPTY